MKPNLHEPKQQRSRETLRALLTATVRLLDKDGLENCTLPRIADEAGVSAASVYRRFSDKDALVKGCVFEGAGAEQRDQPGTTRKAAFAGRSEGDGCGHRGGVAPSIPRASVADASAGDFSRGEREERLRPGSESTDRAKSQAGRGGVAEAYQADSASRPATCGHVRGVANRVVDRSRGAGAGFIVVDRTAAQRQKVCGGAHSGNGVVPEVQIVSDGEPRSSGDACSRCSARSGSGWRFAISDPLSPFQ
jgi:AcrR family transcriptional regulator